MQWVHCVDTCEADWEPLIPCPEDQLGLTFEGTVSTADGRLDGESIRGVVSGRRTNPGDPVFWSISTLLPVELTRSGFDPLSIAEDPPDTEGAVSWILWLYGEDSALEQANIGYEHHSAAGRRISRLVE